MEMILHPRLYTVFHTCLTISEDCANTQYMEGNICLTTQLRFYRTMNWQVSSFGLFRWATSGIFHASHHKWSLHIGDVDALVREKEACIVTVNYLWSYPGTGRVDHHQSTRVFKRIRSKIFFLSVTFSAEPHISNSAKILSGFIGIKITSSFIWHPFKEELKYRNFD